MDLAKFVSIIATESLYFACPLEFRDPFEGYLPKSHIEAFLKVTAPMIQNINDLRNQLRDQLSTIDIQQIDHKLNDISILDACREASRKFGVTCWHKSQYESEAMWKLYSASGQGIAIESTIKQLKLSLQSVKELIIDSVRYMDFDKDSIEKGYRHYVLFLKRKSFEYEQELRATIPLLEQGKGIHVKCDLNTLITRIHISPFAQSYFIDAVEAVCHNKVHTLDKPVVTSKLFDNPDYNIKT